MMFIMTCCPTCGVAPCTNLSFCAACRSADVRKAKGEAPRFSEASYWRNPSDRIPDNWEEMSLEGLVAHFERARSRDSAAEKTVEALMFNLRERGTKARADHSRHGKPLALVGKQSGKQPSRDGKRATLPTWSAPGVGAAFSRAWGRTGHRPAKPVTRDSPASSG